MRVRRAGRMMMGVVPHTRRNIFILLIVKRSVRSSAAFSHSATTLVHATTTITTTTRPGSRARRRLSNPCVRHESATEVVRNHGCG